jgi:hypothetical protein
MFQFYKMAYEYIKIQPVITNNNQLITCGLLQTIFGHFNHHNQQSTVKIKVSNDMSCSPLFLWIFRYKTNSTRLCMQYHSQQWYSASHKSKWVITKIRTLYYTRTILNCTILWRTVAKHLEREEGNMKTIWLWLISRHFSFPHDIFLLCPNMSNKHNEVIQGYKRNVSKIKLQ